jgi:hypothetical protein
MYCLGCYYDLRGLPAETQRCPECGRYFDPAAPHTYTTRSRPPTVWEVLTKAAETAAQAMEPPNERIERLERQLRGRTSSAFAEVDYLRRVNEVLRERLDWALALLERNGIVGAAEVAQVRADIERASRSVFDAIEFPEEEGVAASEELKALAAAAKEVKKSGE